MRILFFALLLAAFPACAQTCEVKTPWDLWRSSETTMRGANLWQTSLLPEDGLGEGPMGPAYGNLHELAQWGANYVNLSVPGPSETVVPYRFRPDVLDAIEALANQALRADLFVVLSVRTGPGRDEKGFGGAENANHEVWKKASAQGRWEGMWRQLAERFKSHPAVVAYDLMVEPNANDVWLKLWDPTDFYPQYENSLYDWNRMAANLVRAIREVDSQKPIVVGAMNHSSASWFPALKPIDDPRIIYAVHQYEPYAYTHQAPNRSLSYPGSFDADWDGKPDQVNRDWLRRLSQPVVEFSQRHQVPIVANEFGVKRWAKGGHRFVGDQIKVFESKGWNHALWLWESDHPGVNWDMFDLRKGPDPENHDDVSDSPLIEVVQDAWGDNTCRPSLVPWINERPPGPQRPKP